jgi:hypothetical protein
MNLDAIGETRASELRLLSVEPAIARIVAIDEAGKARTYFTSRATPHRSPRDESAVASYRSPIGRLASLPVGSDIELKTPTGNQLQIAHSQLRYGFSIGESVG